MFINYIIDSSFVLAQLLPDENINTVEEIFSGYEQGNIQLSSSPLLPFEVINGLKSAVLSKRIEQKLSLALVEEFFAIKITLEKLNFKDVLSLSINKNCSVYNASYLWLAQSNKLPLLTLDKKLKAFAS